MVGLAGKSIKGMFFILIILILFSSITVFADKSFVFDDAMLFNEEGIIGLEEKANLLSTSYNMDIIIVTTNDAMGKTSMEYADDFFDYNGFGVGDNFDGILFLIDMDNGEAYISTSGIGIKYLTDERIERVLDDVFDSGLVEGDYYGATLGFLKGTEEYLKAGIPSDQHNYPEEPKEKNRLTFFDLIISLLGGLGSFGIFFISIKSKYKMKKPVKPLNFRNNSIVSFTENEDKLIDSFVTTRVIPKPQNNSSSSSSGRSTTHKSSSGRSHGGGGRKFK
ncbi:TPM domain-containing protein [Tissierella sp.]|uniref:TPM domain-containing protein n=1 Tax=Tissierella sp. TaxID=41274 RepID=UPI00285E3C0C|nr:TPM domain-containing protein [Tissierella sp.]MDR7855984.1 TPM domain-containing protein [Tissierella sp.]